MVHACVFKSGVAALARAPQSAASNQVLLSMVDFGAKFEKREGPLIICNSQLHAAAM
jgi:hypothetical protein